LADWRLERDKAFAGTNMALMGGGGRWEDGKGEKSRQKREWQKAASEENNAEFGRFQFLTAALMKIHVLWGV
jgi:hypothetical protein